MRGILRTVLLGLIVAVLTVTFSFVADVNFVWIFAMALFVAEMEGAGILFVVLSGFVLDIGMHNQLGYTAIVFLGGSLVFIIAKALRLTIKWWMAFIVTVLVFAVITVFECYDKLAWHCVVDVAVMSVLANILGVIIKSWTSRRAEIKF